MDFNLTINFAILILLLIVQIIIYPGFRDIPKEKFIKFHKVYTFKISLIVIPLFIAQIISEFIISKNFSNPIHTIAIILLWLVTFTLAVPCHNKLSKAKHEKEIEKLIKVNAIRVVLGLLIILS